MLEALRDTTQICTCCFILASLGCADVSKPLLERLGKHIHALHTLYQTSHADDAERFHKSSAPASRTPLAMLKDLLNKLKAEATEVIVKERVDADPGRLYAPFVAFVLAF